MLYGDSSVIINLMDIAKKVAEKNNFELVFAAVQGSISRGLSRYDSDYDIRFLYKDKSNNICVKKDFSEKEVVYRYYPVEKTFFDKIAFWDIYAFLSFLENPELDKAGLSCGLYNQVFWTLTSPYVWDPYGLVNKITPIANKIINKKWLMDYFLEYIEMRRGKDHVIIRDYIYIVATIWQMQWLIASDAYPPLYMKTLEFICDDTKVKEIVNKYIKDLQNVNKIGIGADRKSHSLDKKKSDGYLDKWIDENIEKLKTIRIQSKKAEDVEEGMNYIYSVLEKSFLREKIMGVHE